MEQANLPTAAPDPDDLLDEVVLCAPVGMALLDASLRYTRVNHRIAMVNGHAPQAHIGRRPRDLLPPEIATLIEDAARQVLASGMPIDNQEIACDDGGAPDGQVTWLVSYYPVGMVDGRARGVGVMMTDISERKRAERALRESLREKDALLQEIRHRVKNNLQVIASLLDLQAMAFGESPVGAAFIECRRRVRSMSLVHELLSSTDERTAVSFPTYVDTLLHYLCQTYTGALLPELQAEIDDIRLDADTAVPCALIISELVTNSLKHAFPPGMRGTIWVTCREHGDGSLTLTARDNGVGLPEDGAPRRADALGLRLVRTLASQLHGTVTQYNDSGAVVTVTFTPPAAARKG